MQSARNRTHALLLACCCGFFLFYGLNQFGLVGADEPRYAQVAREMLDRHDWITPVLGGQPWLEKPPLYYWQAMVADSVFGVTDWAARLPGAVDAALLVLALYFFLRRFRRGYEMEGALIAVSSAGVVGLGRAAATDMPLAATFSIAMLVWWAWRESGSRVYLAAFYAWMGLGVLAKGPVAPLLAGAVIVLYAAAAGELRLIWRTLWLPGLALFLAVALPWYIAAQMRNPQFFRTFILEHNLSRFSSNLYHHRQPFWFYAPVMLLALMPWTVFILAAVVRTARMWWSEKTWQNRPAEKEVPGNGLSLFALCWLLVPVSFFSLSQSKLPAYILPAVPAGALLLVEYIRQNIEDFGNQPPPRLLVILHGLVAAAPVFPALLIQYLVTQHRIPPGKPALIASAISALLAVMVVVMLSRKAAVRALRFTTLIPAVLAVGLVFKLGAATLNDYLSARPLAEEISRHQPHAMPFAVQGVRREIEYGLAFYRNQPPLHDDGGTASPGEYLLVVPQGYEVAPSGRRTLLLGRFDPQQVDYYWVLPAGMPMLKP